MAGDGDFAENEERAIGLDLDRNVGLAEETLTQARLDGAASPPWSDPCARTMPISGKATLPAPSTEKELERASWPNTITRSRSPLANR